MNKQIYFLFAALILLAGCNNPSNSTNNTNESGMQTDLLSLKTVIRSSDFAASKKFYTEILNLTIVDEYEDKSGSRGCIVRFGNEKSNAFFEIAEIPSNNSFFDESFAQKLKNDKTGIQIRTDSISYWAKRLAGQVEIKGPVERPWGSSYLYLRDPDGLQIIIYQEKE
jgi:catechol 2,3-dioxygenase-like lactoylglutathione lyase family enzyme